MEGAVFRHPLLERDSLGILADHVTLEQGTGAVHTAPGHGQEDYAIGQKYGIATYCPVDAAGRFFRAEGAPGHLPDELIGKTVWEGNPIVLELLQEAGALLGMEKLAHSYPHCWRCHNPVIFRATEQWFIGMELNNFRQDALEAIKRVKWMPEWGQERISNMIAVRPDWCISRQRVWGVPIIVFYCEGCREPVTDRKILDGIVKLFAEHTADVWYERTAAELLPAGHKCAKCGGTEFAKETDILDVWFDSGSSHLAVLNDSFGLPWPADVYLEGGDQYRGWFHSSLLVGTGLRGGAPYRACLLNGWVLDGEGKAMHKSLGNSIEPESVIKDHGADILRLWTAIGGVQRRRAHVAHDSDAPGGRLSQAAQHVPLHAGQPGGLRSGDRRGAGRRDGGAGPVDSAARRRPGGALPRLVRQLRVPQGLSRGVRLLHGGPELGLLRRAEGPAVHHGAEIAGAAQRADRAVPPAGRVRAPAGAADELHRRRSLGAHGAPG